MNAQFGNDCASGPVEVIAGAEMKQSEMMWCVLGSRSSTTSTATQILTGGKRPGAYFKGKIFSIMPLPLSQLKFLKTRSTADRECTTATELVDITRNSTVFILLDLPLALALPLPRLAVLSFFVFFLPNTTISQFDARYFVRCF